MQNTQAIWIRTQDGELVNIAGARRFTATDPDREGMVAIEVHFSDDGEEYDVIAIIPRADASQVFEHVRAFLAANQVPILDLGQLLGSTRTPAP